MDELSLVSERGSKSASTRLVVLLGTLLVLAAAVMTLAGCPSATPKATPEPEEEAVEPTLLGTWTAMGGYYKDNEHVGSVTYTLTFTKSRWIQHTVEILDDGTVDNQWADSGTWEVVGSMVTRKWVDEDDDQRVDRSVDKDYYFANADVVFIHHWDSDDIETRYSRYVRVEDPLPTLIGIWRASLPAEGNDGTPWIDERTIAINADGSFSYIRERESRWKYELSAKWHIDHEEYFINITESVAIFTRPDGEDRTSGTTD